MPCMHCEIKYSGQSADKGHFQKFSLDHAVLPTTSKGFPRPDEFFFTIGF